MDLWTAKKPNLQIIETCQTKIIRYILGAPRYVRNSILLRDLQLNSVRNEAVEFCRRYMVRLTDHPNITARRLVTAKRFSRLQRTDPLDL